MVKSNAKLGNKNEHKGLRLDQWDIDNIRNALAIYDKMNPPGKVHTLEEGGKQYIEYCNLGDHLSYMRSVTDQKRKLKFGKKNEVDVTLKLSIPPSLESWLNKAYPKLFTDEVQTAQFLKAFPRFNLE